MNDHFIPYSISLDKEFSIKAFTFYNGWGIPIVLNNEEMESLAKYPESFKCIAGK